MEAKQVDTVDDPESGNVSLPRRSAFRSHHGEFLPDPYQVLDCLSPWSKETFTDEDRASVQRWIDHQGTKIEEILGSAEDRAMTAGELAVYSIKDGAEETDDSGSRSVLGVKWVIDDDGTNRLTLAAGDEPARTIYRDKDYRPQGVSAKLSAYYMDLTGEVALVVLKGEGQARYLYALDLSQNIELMRVPIRCEHFKLESWHPSRRGFYYSSHWRDGAEGKWKRSLFYKNLSGPSSPPEKVIDVEIGASSVRFHHSQRTDFVQFDVRDADLNHSTYIADPESPHIAIRIPLPERQEIIKSYVFGQDELSYFVAVQTRFFRSSCYALPKLASDWSQASALFEEAPCESIYDVGFADGRIVTIQSIDLQSVLVVIDPQCGSKSFHHTPTRSKLKFAHPFMKDGKVRFRASSYLEPWVDYALDLTDLTVEETARFPAPIWTKNIEVRREFAATEDGTKIPITLLCPKSFQAGTPAPLILIGYGGFGYCELPRYDHSWRYWTRKGGLVAFAHVRGDAGWLPGWEKGGTGDLKESSFNDFNACAQHLIKNGWTSSDVLASWGASNGGLTVLAAMQRRPDLYSCVVASAPMVDILNSRRPPGLPDKENYGDPSIASSYSRMRAYSPLQNIRPLIPQPKVLIAAGGKDTTVDSSQSLRFVATMQEICGHESCYLLYFPDRNHKLSAGGARNERALTADRFRFIEAAFKRRSGVN